MPRAILLNDDFDTIKRLWFRVDGGATVQHFTKTGRVEIPLTAEELELVRTSCRPCDDTYEQARQDLACTTSRFAEQFGGEVAKRIAADLDDHESWASIAREYRATQNGSSHEEPADDHA